MTQIKPADSYDTPLGTLQITPLGHASLRLEINGKIIQVDPYSEVHDYNREPKADLILITHQHYDHLDRQAIAKIITLATEVIAPPEISSTFDKGRPITNGEKTVWNNITIEAVPAYNIKHKNNNGQLFHPKGKGNGYVMNFGAFRLYIAGDTEPIAEMRTLGPIDVAFLPKNLPYTMDDQMFVEAAKIVKAKTLYPYHWFEVDKPALQKALEGVSIIK
jgi:L-ascorbate metabolism protein UlaG (beta-lactamase superfamily)